MRFSIFYEHQLPRPWDEGAEHRLFQDALDQVELADRAGFDTVWEVEHHFLEEYSHSSASDVFLAAASQRTQRIRLGLGILPLPPGYQHPARVAETVATLDLVSSGRVEFGTGETSSGAELGGFGVDRDSKRAQWEEMLDVVARMMVEAPFAGHEGAFLSMPPRNVVPKPMQKPHPPMWVACSRRETIRLAAEKGLGALSFSFVEPEEAKAWVDEYYEIIASERCVPGGFSVNPNFAVALPMMVAREEAEAIERGIDGAHFFGYALAHYYVFGDHHPGRTSIWEEFEQRREQVGFARSVIKPGEGPLGINILQQGLGSLRGAVGTPDQVRELARRYEAAGVDEMIFCLQAGKNRHEHICEAIELFGAEVIPEFAAEREERDRDKAQRLAGVAEAALARRAPPRAADPAYRINPSDSGPSAVLATADSATPGSAGGGRRRVAGRPARALRRSAERRGEAAFTAFVQRSDDRRLERTVGSSRGLKVVFKGMERAFEPEQAAGFAGDLQYDLLGMDGQVRHWTVSVGPGGCSTRPGSAVDPKLTIRIGLADFVRLAARDLDAGKALLTGRLDLQGDISVAMRLGEMFGQPSTI